MCNYTCIDACGIASVLCMCMCVCKHMGSFMYVHGKIYSISPEKLISWANNIPRTTHQIILVLLRSKSSMANLASRRAVFCSTIRQWRLFTARCRTTFSTTCESSGECSRTCERSRASTCRTWTPMTGRSSRTSFTSSRLAVRFRQRRYDTSNPFFCTRINVKVRRQKTASVKVFSKKTYSSKKWK